MKNKEITDIIGHEFLIDTEIITKITWKEQANDNRVELLRKKFEETIQGIANFLNQSLGTVILQALKAQKEENSNEFHLVRCDTVCGGYKDIGKMACKVCKLHG